MGVVREKFGRSDQSERTSFDEVSKEVVFESRKGRKMMMIKRRRRRIRRELGGESEVDL